MASPPRAQFTVRELSRAFHRLLISNPPSNARQALVILRNALQSTSPMEVTTITETRSIQNSFTFLLDRIRHATDENDDSLLVSVLIDTLIMPCYQFYSNHPVFFSDFFNLFSKLISHSSIINHQNYLYSIAVIISRSSIYNSRVATMSLEKWSIELWLGKSIGENLSTQELRFKYEKPFPFTENSNVAQTLTDNTRYPIDMSTQFLQWINRNRPNLSTGHDDLEYIEIVINHLFDCQFILKSFINDDGCLSSILTFAIKRKHIQEVRIVNEADIQAKTQLESIKRKMLNQYEYVPEWTGTRATENIIHSQCQVEWSDGRNFIYRTNIIPPRPSFLSALAKLCRYAWIQMQEQNDSLQNAMWNLLLQKIHYIYTNYAQTCPSLPFKKDFENFLQYFFRHNDQKIQQMSIDLLRSLLNNISILNLLTLPALINSSIIGNLFQSCWQENRFEIDETLLNGCLDASSRWSIDDIFSFLIILIEKFRMIFDDHPQWLTLFLNIVEKNYQRFSFPSVKTNKEFVRFSRMVDKALVKHVLNCESSNVYNAIEFLIEYCEIDWLTILLEMFNDNQCRFQWLKHGSGLFKKARLHAFNRWKVSSSFKLLLDFLHSSIDHFPLVFLEFSQLFKEMLNCYSIRQIQSRNIDFHPTMQLMINILQQLFTSRENPPEYWNDLFRRELLSITVSIILAFFKQNIINLTSLDMNHLKRIVQSTFYLSIDYEQIVRLILFIFQSKQLKLIDYWLNHLLVMCVVTNANLDDEEKRQYLLERDENTSFEFQTELSVNYFGINHNELIDLLKEKIVQTTTLTSSLPSLNYFSIGIQRSISKYFPSLLHSEERISSSILDLLKAALNIQSRDTMNLFHRLKEKIDHSSMTNKAINDNEIDDDRPSFTRKYLLKQEENRLESAHPSQLDNPSNFQKLINDLKRSLQNDDPTEDNLSQLTSMKDLRHSCPDEYRHLIPNRSLVDSLFPTETMLKNRERILECIQTPIHLLLQGETGVGKTSLILDVAYQLQKPLIRFNFSVKTDISNLFGSFCLRTTNSNDQQRIVELDFQEGPFTLAFRSGHWLLLDEMNLASANVLQAIEQSIETGILILPNIEDDDQRNDNQSHCRTYQMHPDFRLFATQNPSLGQYKIGRNVQSTALMTRFNVFIVEGPMKGELTELVRHRLKMRQFPFTQQERLMVDLHENLILLIQSTNFNERNRNYAEITIRELFRWCDHLANYEFILNSISQSIKTSHLTIFNRIVAEQALVIYALRFHQSSSQEQIINQIERSFQLNPLPTDQLQINISRDNKIQFQSGSRLLLQMSLINIDSLRRQWTTEINVSINNKELQQIFRVHNTIFKRLHSGLINRIYHCSSQLIFSVIKRRFETDLRSLPVILKDTYGTLSRNENERKMIWNCIEQECSQSDNNDETSSLSSYHPVFYLDTQTDRLIQYVLSSPLTQPILIVGPEGSGKSHFAQCLANLFQVRCEHLYLTPQTEPSALVGSVIPNIQCPQWQDGPVSEAIEKGHWLILENFSEASSAVLERLNSVLEQPPQWIKLENNQTTPVTVSSNFRLIATMSPPSYSRLQNASIQTNHELTPALYNRFLIIYYQGLDVLSKKTFENLFQSYFPNIDQLLIDSIFSQMQSLQLTTREFLQWLDCAFQFQNSSLIGNCSIDLSSILLSALELVFNLHFSSHSQTSIKMKFNRLKQFLTEQSRSPSIDWFNLLIPQTNREQIREYIIDPQSTPSRYEAAKRCCASVICSRPILLEGPAATGKTSLIEYLAKCLQKTLYRISNTQDTTIQDYFGSYMPDGHFYNGSLSDAMSGGHWFVADEFNLAEPAVLNVLYPILEGQKKIRIPNTNQFVLVHQDFRFFATQNETKYLGRKQLPKTLRSRFFEIHFDCFNERELEYILIQRNPSSSDSFNRILQSFAPRIASTFIHVNEYIQTKQNRLFGGDHLQLTMREMIKWIRRIKKNTNISWKEHALRLFQSRVPEQFQQEFLQCLQNERALPQSIDTSIRVIIEGHTISLRISISSLMSYSFVNEEFARDLQLQTTPASFLLSLWRIFAAVDQQEPILLLGPTSCKSHLIKIWAKLMGRESNLRIITCSSSTETSDLIGSIRYFQKKILFLLHLLFSLFFI